MKSMKKRNQSNNAAPAAPAQPPAGDAPMKVAGSPAPAAAAPATPATPAAAGAAPPQPSHPKAGPSRRLDAGDRQHQAAAKPIPRWRQRLNEGFKTFLWVGPLTALIWIYAERAQIASLEVSVEIEPKSSSPDRVVTLVSDDSVTVAIRAPRASLDALQQALSDSRQRPIEIMVPEDIQPPFEGDISVTDRIERNPLFERWAVDVERSFPAVRIRVEEKVSREVKVTVRSEDNVFASVTFDPPVVALEGPKSFFSESPAEELVVYADLTRFKSNRPDTYLDVVTVSTPAERANVRVLPNRVKATVVIKPSESETLPSVPVWITYPAFMLEKFNLRIPTGRFPVLTNVEVTGPPAVIEKIRQDIRNRVSVGRVKIEITPEDLEKPSVTKTISEANYEMPKDVMVKNPNRDFTFENAPR